MSYPLTRCCLVAMLCAAILTGCDARHSPVRDSDELRVVSLTPAISQMIVDMGLADVIVAVGQHDDAAPPGLPVVGNFLEVDAEALLQARPTHVFTMFAKEGTSPQLSALAQNNGFILVSYPAPLSVEDVARILQPQNATAPRGLGQVLGAEQEAAKLRQRILHQLHQIENLTAKQPPPRVLMVININPLMASGPDTTHDHLLKLAGGVNAAMDASVRAPTYDRENLLRLNPDVILLLLPRALPLESFDNDWRLAIFCNLPIPAVTNKRIVLINHPLVQLPSSSVPHTVAAMAKAIHSDLSDQIDQVMTDEAASLEADHAR